MKELLDHGADVDAIFGELQTTPLQWAIWQKQLDITRLLLSEGASQDHVNTIGWNTAFFCWPALEVEEEKNMLEFLNLLDTWAYQDLDVADTEGWTALHRVAAYATPSEVERLIHLGAKPGQAAPPLLWNAIHHAVFYGNYATFVVLEKYYDVNIMVDDRGWTLLHIAASAGHDRIVRHLLLNGANKAAKSLPYYSHMPESLFGCKCTPQEVAAAQGTQIENQYLDALREAEEDVEFWETVESFA